VDGARRRKVLAAEKLERGELRVIESGALSSSRAGKKKGELSVPVYRRKTTKSKRWYFKFQIRGKVYKETIPTARTKRQAEEAERQARDDVHSGRYGSNQDMLFSEFVVKHYLPWAEQHHKNKVSDKTMTDLLCEHFKLPLGRISRFTVETFKLKMAKSDSIYGRTYKPNTVNLALAYLSIILNLAVEYKKIRENPVSKVKRLPVEEKRPRHLSPEEEQRLLPVLETERPYLKPLVQLAIWTGFRRGELLALRTEHIDFARNLIFVPFAKWKRDKRKTEGNPMSLRVREMVQELCATSGYLFSEDGKPISRSVLDKRFRRACRQAEINDLTFHALRHTFGTRLGEQDVNLKKIARLMGHTSTKHTEIYVHTTDAGLMRAMEMASVEGAERSNSFKVKVAEGG